MIMIIGYQIKTFHNTLLCTNAGLIGHSEKPSSGTCLYLFLFDDDCAIIIPESNIIKLLDSKKDFTFFSYDKEFPVPALFCIIKQSSRKDPVSKKVFLVHSKFRYLFSAVPLSNDDVGKFKPNTYAVKEWEEFDLVQPTFFGIGLDAFINSHKPNFYPKSEDILQSLIDNDYTNFLNFMNLISYDELSTLARSLLGNTIFVNKLLQMFKNDIFIQHLHSYIQEQNIYSDRGNFYINSSKVTNYSVGSEYDFLGGLYCCDFSRSPAQLLLSYIRGLIKPIREYSTAVVTTMRNEGPYVVEFVAYYKAIGFDKIYVYSNNNNDNSDELLSMLAKYGYITYITNILKDGCSPQGKAYMHAATLNFDLLENDWTLFVDTDEFFTFNTAFFKDVKEYLMYMNRNKIDSICLNWVFVGANERIFYDKNKTTLDSYHCASNISPQIKSFVRTNKIGSLQAHFPFARERDMLASVHSKGTIQKSYKYNQGPLAKAFSDDLDADYASVIHYWSRSLYEYIYKFSKSRGDHPLNSAVTNFGSLDEGLARLFIHNFDNSQIDLDSLIGANKEKMRAYIQDIYKHEEIEQLDLKIKTKFDELTKTAVEKFVEQFANTELEYMKKLVDLVKKYKNA